MEAKRTVPELMAEIRQVTEEIQEIYLQGKPFVVGWSGGKDSTAVLQLVWRAIAQLPTGDRSHPIHVLTNDTLVENPVVAAQVRNSLKQMEQVARKQEMPIATAITTPKIKDTFWVSLIGKGYAAPRRGFRWCTDRLKIQPANQFIRESISLNGETILVLGTRKSESVSRGASMERHKTGQMSDHLSTNSKSSAYRSDLREAIVYSPIEDWRTDEVWLYLMQFDNPWGCDNKDLLAMYRGATADNECPLVVDTSTPSCGSSRFGCWTCTLVNKDKSMEAMILNDREKEWMQPLLDIRNELDVDDDRDRRDYRRMNGTIGLYEKKNSDGTTSLKPIPGPYTRVWREHWLRRVLEAQTHTRKTAPEGMRDITLISPEELSEIRRIWLEEKYEFDDSLPRIYKEVTGEAFEGDRARDDRAALSQEDWDVLESVCEGDSNQIELIAGLLVETEKHGLSPSRKGVFKAIEKQFARASGSREEELNRATENYKIRAGCIQELKQQLTTKNPEPQGKQLSWADIKFSNPN